MLISTSSLSSHSVYFPFHSFGLSSPPPYSLPLSMPRSIVLSALSSGFSRRGYRFSQACEISSTNTVAFETWSSILPIRPPRLRKSLSTTITRATTRATVNKRAVEPRNSFGCVNWLRCLRMCWFFRPLTRRCLRAIIWRGGFVATNSTPSPTYHRLCK
jgi:hypothetical protein